MSQEHLLALSTLCRVCGAPFKNKKGPLGRKHSCSDRRTDLLDVFEVNIGSDSPNLHPPSFCHSCNNIMYHARRKAKSGETEYTPKKVIATWHDHSEHHCPVCIRVSTHSVGGRPKKQVYTPGRPPMGSVHTIVKHISMIAPPSLYERGTIKSNNHILDCPICLDIPDRPIELKHCGSLLCADCLCQWLHTSKCPTCPCCFSEHISELDIEIPSPVTLRALSGLEVTCCHCNKRG